jgi:hypothetical protein
LTLPGLRPLNLGLLLLPLPTLYIKLLHLGVELFDLLFLVIALRLRLLSQQVVAHVLIHLHALVVVGVGIGRLEFRGRLRLHLLVNLKEGLVEVVLIPGLGLRLEFGKLAVTLVLLLLNQEVPISLEATTAIVSGLHLRDLLVCKLFFGLFTLLSHNISHRTPVFLGLFRVLVFFKLIEF